MPYLPPLFPKARARQKTARMLYDSVMLHSRNPIFYTQYKVPDSFDGRFELVALHVGLLINRLKTEGVEGTKLAQALFDVMFLNLELACREMGIGDLSVPRHMKRMMNGLNGRAKAYDTDELADPITRNIYGTILEIAPETIKHMVLYVKDLKINLAAQSAQDIQSGIINFEFKEVYDDEKKYSA